MRNGILLLFLCALMILCTSCETADKVAERVKTNIEDIADGFSDTGQKEEPKPETENSIRIGIAEFDTFNPLLTKSQTVREAMQTVFEPLFETDEAMRTVPVLAAEYSVTADGLTYSITVKSDVLWHDGTQFTAYDAAYTIKQLQSIKTVYSDNVSEIADCRAENRNTLKIVLKRPVMQFAALLSFPIVPNGSDMSGAANYVPVGTGAFMFGSKSGIDEYTFNAYDMYHNGRAKTDRLYIREAPDNERCCSMFNVSETDLLTSNEVNLMSYMPSGQIHVNDFCSNRMTFAGFNLRSSAMAETNTREGIAELIDKKNIVDSVLYSRGVESDIAVNPYSWLYYDTNTDFRANYENAMALLGNDGWGLNEDGIMQRTVKGRTEKLRPVILVNGDSDVKVKVAESIKKDLEKCGINAVIDKEKYERYVQKIAAHDFDMMIGEFDLGANQDIFLLAGSQNNYFSYGSEEADTLMAQAGMMSNEESVKEIYKSLGEILRRDAPFTPIYYAKESVLSSGKLKDGIYPSVTGFYRVSNIWSVLE